jgi:hypothetical protein
LPGLLGHLEPNRLPCFPLANRRPIPGISVWGDILHPERDDVATAELAIDGQIEHCQVAQRPSTWSLVRIDQTCFGRSGGFAPISLPLFQGLCLDTVAAEFS